LFVFPSGVLLFQHDRLPGGRRRLHAGRARTQHSTGALLPPQVKRFHIYIHLHAFMLWVFLGMKPQLQPICVKTYLLFVCSRWQSSNTTSCERLLSAPGNDMLIYIHIHIHAFMLWVSLVSKPQSEPLCVTIYLLFVCSRWQSSNTTSCARPPSVQGKRYAICIRIHIYIFYIGSPVNTFSVERVTMYYTHIMCFFTLGGGRVTQPRAPFFRPR